MFDARQRHFVCDDTSEPACPCCQGAIVRISEALGRISILREEPLLPEVAKALAPALANVRNTGAVLLPGLEANVLRSILEARLSDFDDAIAGLDEAIANAAAKSASAEGAGRGLNQPILLAAAIRQLSRHLRGYVAALEPI